MNIDPKIAATGWEPGGEIFTGETQLAATDSGTTAGAFPGSIALKNTHDLTALFSAAEISSDRKSGAQSRKLNSLKTEEDREF